MPIVVTEKLTAKEIEENYTKCEDCGTWILKGDVRYIEYGLGAGNEVCEYCAESYDDNCENYEY